MLEFANNTNRSVHDLETQLDYFRHETKNEIKIAWDIFLSKDSTDEEGNRGGDCKGRDIRNFKNIFEICGKAE